MKRFIVNLLLFLMLLYPCASAQEDAFLNLQTKGNRLCGSVIANSNERQYEIKVDCPVPEAAYPCEALTLGYRYFSQEDLQRALEACGQSIEGHFQNHRDSTQYTGNWNTEASAEITWDEAFLQATQIGLTYFDALGVEVDRTPRHIDRPYDYDYYMQKHLMLYSHVYSDPSYQLSSLTPQWQRTHRYDPKQTAYTKVEFTVMLEGKRLWHQPTYPAGYEDEPDAWISKSVSAYVIVSDSGILVEAGTDNIPEIKGRRPLDKDELEACAQQLYRQPISPLVAAPDWQSALAMALNRDLGAGSIALGKAEQPYQNKSMDAPGILYASQGVITAIRPYLFPLSEHEWGPFWLIESVEEYEDGWRSESFW